MSGKLSEGFATEMPDPSPGKELLRKALKKDIKGESEDKEEVPRGSGILWDRWKDLESRMNDTIDKSLSRLSTLRKVDTTLLDTIKSDVVSEIRKTLIEEASMGTTPVTTTDDVVSKMRLEMREMMKEMVSSIVDIAKSTASTSTGYGLSKLLEKEAE